VLINLVVDLLAALLDPAWRTGAPWPPPGLLLDGEIPHEPGVRTMAT